LVIEEALEAEVSEAVRRGYYDRGLGDRTANLTGVGLSALGIAGHFDNVFCKCLPDFTMPWHRL